MRVFDAWLADEGEITADPMAKMKPPRVPEQPAPVLNEELLRRLLATCAGKDFEGPPRPRAGPAAARHRRPSRRGRWHAPRRPALRVRPPASPSCSAAEAGIENLHAHLFRHTFAHLWLRQGGGETDLMRLARQFAAAVPSTVVPAGSKRKGPR